MALHSKAGFPPLYFMLFFSILLVSSFKETRSHCAPTPQKKDMKDGLFSGENFWPWCFFPSLGPSWWLVLVVYEHAVKHCFICCLKSPLYRGRPQKGESVILNASVADLDGCCRRTSTHTGGSACGRLAGGVAVAWQCCSLDLLLSFFPCPVILHSGITIICFGYQCL